MQPKRWSALVLSMALVTLLGIGAACGGEETQTNSPSGGGPPLEAGLSDLGANYASLASAFASNLTQESGIRVSGTGRVSAEPDQAVITVGVEARNSTVSQARTEAARAMDTIVVALKARGVADRDIQTQHFSISPQYTFVQRTDSSGGRYSEQVLTGYIVSNRSSVVVRELEQIGQIVDEVTEAGGDLTRIQGMSFTLEDPTALHDQAREAAVRAALAKAQQLASLTGVLLGRPVFIAETAATPIVRTSEVRFEAMAAAAPTTPFSSGDLSVEVTIQAVFTIQ